MKAAVAMSKGRKIHFMGVGGIGMSGLAILLADEGNRVSGCDLAVSKTTAKWLSKGGVDVRTGHSKAHLRGVEAIVRSPAVRDDTPELAEAAARGIPVMSRGETLAAYANRRRTIAVCGTHGKTTTSCLTAMLLGEVGGRKSGAGRRQPGAGWCIGGWTDALGCVARSPQDGAPFVIEADESDGTLALYKPAVTVVTSIEQDHLEHFDSFDALVGCFRAVVRATAGAVVYCADDPVCREVAQSEGLRRQDGEDAAFFFLGYGFGEGADLRAVNRRPDGDGQVFDLAFGGEVIRGLRLPLPGRHNLLNALGAIGAALALGHGLGELLPCLGRLRELPHRRFETVRCRAGFDLVSDYSHHPTEIRALLDIAKADGKPLIAIFQPHRYSRTKALLDHFVDAFAALSPGGAAPDRLILLPVYPAFEQPLEGGTTLDLYAKMREANLSGRLGVVPELACSVDEVAAHLRSSRAVADGRRIVVIGAGDIISLVGRLSRIRSVLETEAMPFGVSFGVGAVADRVVEVGDESSLADALRGGRVEVLGQGTNVLPSPLGVRATVLKLRNGALEIHDNGDGTFSVTAGCAIPGAKLLAELARRGLSGLEFMAGIPGTLGGWLAMNAGTRHGEVGDAVASVVAYTRRGRRLELSRRACGFSYRSCRGLAGRVAFSAVLTLRRADPDEIQTKMRGFLEKRFNFAGMRTAGSAFKNPPGGFAGALLEKTGCKGLRIGGAYVSERHANIVAADSGATASDVLALLETMRRRVLTSCGVPLEREIKIV